MTKRLFSLILLITAMTTVVKADGFMEGGLYYVVNPDGVSVTVTYEKRVSSQPSYENISGDLIIPDTVRNKAVTAIGFLAFCDCSGLTSVTLPNTIITIGESAFINCTGLTGSLVIPNSVTTIGKNAFAVCTGLTSLIIGNSVTTIGEKAFQDCTGLRSLSLGNSVTTIVNGAFSGCKGLKGSLIFPNSLTSIGGTAFTHCSGLTGSLVIPDSVTIIGGGAFYNCKGITSLSIGKSMESIGCEAFKYCSSLKQLTLCGGINSVENDAFSGTDIGTLYLKPDVYGIKNLNINPSLIYCLGEIPHTCDDKSFISYAAALHVPQRGMTNYFADEYWGRFMNLSGDAVEPTGIELEENDLNMRIGDTYYLTALLLPENTGLVPSWLSTNNNVAVVDDEGKVTAVGEGEADIIASCVGLTSACHVHVAGSRYSLTLDKHELQMKRNDMVTLTASSPLEDTEFVWSCSNNDVAIMRTSGNTATVMGALPGDAIITVSSVDGRALPDTCKVTVIRPVGDINCDGFTDVSDVNLIY